MKTEVDQMDKFEIFRWVALIEGVNKIYDKSDEYNIKEEDVVLKQNHLVRYIDETTERIRVI